MIDGIDLRVHGLEPSLWLDNPDLSGRFLTKVNTRTGKPIDGVKRATYKGLVFEIVPARDGNNWFTVRGSLHKYWNEGLHNTDQFTFDNLLQVIEDLRFKYAINPNDAVIEGIEFGVNMEMPFEVKKVLTSAIAFKDKTFEVINARKPSLGRLCATHDFDVKLYDKVIQAGSDFPLPAGIASKNLLRFEVKVNKMRWIAPFGIKTLSNLTEIGNVFSLVKALISTLEKVVFVDIHANISMLTPKEQARFGIARDRDKWLRFDKSQRYEIKAQLPRILKKSDAFDYSKLLKNSLEILWSTLFEEAGNSRPSHQNSMSAEAGRIPTVAPFKCFSAIVRNNKEQSDNNKMSKIRVAKLCQSCGRDITEQKGDSKFCSEKYQGKAAKKCRNKNSNERRNKKHTIMKAKLDGAYIAISYRFMDELYTDVLHSSEIETSNEWVDRVVSISIFDDEPASLGNEQARTFLRSLINSHKAINTTSEF